MPKRRRSNKGRSRNRRREREFRSYFVVNVHTSKVEYLRHSFLEIPDKRPYRVLKIYWEAQYNSQESNKTNMGLLGISFNSPYDQTNNVGDLVSSHRPTLISGTVIRRGVAVNKCKLWWPYNTSDQDVIATYEATCLSKDYSENNSIVVNCTAVIELQPEVFKAGCPAMIGFEALSISESSTPELVSNVVEIAPH